MPIFKIDVQKRALGEWWTNVYYVNEASLSAAQTNAAAIVTAEKAIHQTWVTIEKYRISTLTQGDFSYITQEISEAGTRNTTGSKLPLFNCIRVDFNDGHKRPSRKYYRGALMTGDVLGDGAIQTAVVAAISTQAGNLRTSALIVSREGLSFASSSTSNLIAMRQLRRGSKRRLNPVI